MKPALRRCLGLGVSAVFAGAAAGRLARGQWGAAHRRGLTAAAAFLGPTLVRNARWWGPVTTQFSTKKREVWLTLDDGPDPEETPRILEVLKAFQVQATFFCIGCRVEAWPALARAIVEAGHDVQNHTFSHPAFSFWAAPPGRAQREIRRGSAAIYAATGQWPTLFRTPAGLANPFVHEAAASQNLRMTGWSAAGQDGIRHDPDRVVSRIGASARPGGIVLLHENLLPGMRPGQRAATLARVLEELERRDLRVVRGGDAATPCGSPPAV